MLVSTMLSFGALLNASRVKTSALTRRTLIKKRTLGLVRSRTFTRMASNYSTAQQDSITKRLAEKFSPIHLAIENESYKHAVPQGAETHFKVIVVSDKFEGMPLIEQHRMVNDTCLENLQNGVHALAIKTMTPAKWQALYEKDPSAAIFQTPNCLGGSKNDPLFKKPVL